MPCACLKITGFCLTLLYTLCFLFQTWAIFLNMHTAFTAQLPDKPSGSAVISGPFSLPSGDPAHRNSAVTSWCRVSGAVHVGTLLAGDDVTNKTTNQLLAHCRGVAGGTYAYVYQKDVGSGQGRILCCRSSGSKSPTDDGLMTSHRKLDGAAELSVELYVQAALYSQLFSMLGILVCACVMFCITNQGYDVTGTLSIVTVVTAISGLLSCLAWNKATGEEFQRHWQFAVYVACYFYVLAVAIPVLACCLIRRRSLNRLRAQVKEFGPKCHVGGAKCQAGGAKYAEGGAKYPEKCSLLQERRPSVTRLGVEGVSDKMAAGACLQSPYPCQAHVFGSNTVKPTHYRDFLAARRTDVIEPRDSSSSSGSEAGDVTIAIPRDMAGLSRDLIEDTPLLKAHQTSINANDD